MIEKEQKKQRNRKLIRLACAAASCSILSLSAKIPARADGGSEGKKEQQVTMYGIGSTSKMAVTAAVMKLYGEGKVDIDAPLTRYIPEFSMADSRYTQITPRMLLDHSSGIPGGTLTGAMLLGDNDTYNHDTLLTHLKTQRLKADPGDFGTYCNDGFTLAEILVERVTGSTFTDYLEQEFSIPLGLSSFKTPQSPDIAPLLAPIYDSGTGKQLPPENANVIGSGGIYSTAEDLCRFATIFMDAQEENSTILPSEMSEAMEYSAFEKTYNPEGKDSTLSYGLGWDSVNAYPFSRYGIKALVKGGDATYYHSSLTVLPRENIACAVLTSGGDSTSARLAVQDILLSYMAETGRISQEELKAQSAANTGASTETQPSREQTVSIPERIMSCQGWYAGATLLKVEIAGNGTLTLSSEGDGHDRTQTYFYDGADSFTSTGSSYVNASGTLTRGSNGRIGRTTLSFTTDSAGRTFLMAQGTETYPGLGRTATFQPVATKIEENQIGAESISAAILEPWKKISGKEFYLVSEKYSSASYGGSFMVKPHVLETPGPYLTFEDSALRMARITGSSEAGFFQQTPGLGRDLNDYRIDEKNGRTYLSTNSERYLLEDDVEQLTIGSNTSSVIIGTDGETVWYSLDTGAGYGFLTIEAPENSSYYIYDGTGKELSCTGSSYTISPGQKLQLPESGKIAFSGKPGTVFTIRRVS